MPFSPDVPNIARMYDYYLGGKDHLAADRAAAEAILRDFPEVALIARANRAFQACAVAFAAAQGITQFLDLGAGQPTAPASHHTARATAPDARVAYIDNDAVVIAQSRALLAVDENIAVIPADLRDAGAALFRAPRGTHLRAATTEELAALMDQVEQAAGRPRPRPRHLDT